MNPTTPERPSSIATAVRLMWIGAGFSLLSVVYNLISARDYKDRIREELIDQGRDASPEKVDQAFNAGLTFAVVFGLLVVGLWALMAWKNGAGRGWARHAATIFGALNVIGAASSLGRGDMGALSVVSTLISVVIAAATLFLLWRPESSKFYTDSAAARSA